MSSARKSFNRSLDRVKATRRISACHKPASIHTADAAFAPCWMDLGTIFTAIAIDVGVFACVQAWITGVGSKTAYVIPGSPWEKGYVESFTARLRDELLNGEIS